METPHVYVFSCGHNSDSGTPGYLKCENANWISLEKETQQNGKKYLKEAILSSALCGTCKLFPGTFENNGRYRDDDLKVIVSLLEDSLRVLGDEKTGEQAKKADEAVKLLTRIAKAYPLCQSMKPCNKEMRQFIVFSTTLVGMAVLEVESTEADKLKKPKLVYVEGQAYDLNALVGSAHEFSDGTIDRQLRGIVPPGASASLPQPDRLTKVTASLNVPEHDQGVLESAIALVKSQKTVAKVAIVEAKQYLSSSSYEEDCQSEGSESEGFCEDIGLWGFGFGSVPELSSQSTSHSASHPSTLPTSPLTEENRLVSDFMEWRDSWACDICGTDCFCRYLPE